MRFVFREADDAVSAPRARIRAACRGDETDAVRALLGEAALPTDRAERVERLAREFVADVRTARRSAGGIDAFLHAYDLSTREGVALMCVAEALLRIPDPANAERLIRDKIGTADWQRHLGDSESLFVNASTWGPMLTGRIVGADPEWAHGTGGLMARLVSRLGEPVIREAMVHAMRIVGQQFVMGRTIEEAPERARKARAPGERYSFDMLGEAARTAVDAARYLDAYRHAIDRVGNAARADGPLAAPGISVKLSALHPRYEEAQRARVLGELAPRFVDLAGWDGLGLAVQAYQKRAVHVITWLDELARDTGRRIPVRLVKGAYWDTEIKRAQERGLDGFPVFTRKASTDVSYIACARRLLACPASFFAQFATHNAQTLATVLVLAGEERAGFEFQRLHGMGEALYRSATDTRHGTFVAPALIEIDRVSVLEREVFGPVLHVLRFRRDRLDALIDEIEATGYGLTLGIHTRIDAVARRIAARARAGSVYVNRNMIGAVVGSQPFGGEGLSGTGPKAGGPRYLHRFAVERVVSTDTTAAGGNAALMALGDVR